MVIIIIIIQKISERGQPMQCNMWNDQFKMNEQYTGWWESITATDARGRLSETKIKGRDKEN